MTTQKTTADLFHYMQLMVGDDALQDLIVQSKNAFKLIELKKNEFLVKEKEVCAYFCYIESGILQHAILVDDDEKTTYLALETQ